MMGLSVLFPVLSPLGRELELTELQIGSLSTAYALMQLLASPFWGRRSERVGRKPILLGGVLGFSFGFAAFGVVAWLGLQGTIGTTVTYVLLVCARLAGGFFSSATMPTAQAYVADVTARNERTSGMAIIGAAFGLGIIIGPAIGAGLAQIDLLAPVWFSAGAALVNAVFVRAWVPEPERRVSSERPQGLLRMAKSVWPLLIVGAAANLASISMEQTVAFYFQDRLELSATATARTVGIALVVYGVAAVLTQGFLVRRPGMTARILLMGGVPVAAAGLTLFVFASDFWSLTGALVLQGFGQGLVMPGLISALSLSVSDDEQGVVAGLSGSAQSVGRLAGPIMGTGLYQLRPELPYAVGAVTLVVAYGLLLFYRWSREPAVEAQAPS
jgi:MFS family permease